MRDEPIPEVPVENLGPCMLACTPMMRKFVVGWIGARGKNVTRIAKAAGYSDVKEGAKVRAFELMNNPKVREALREEADRRLDGIAVLAVLGIGDLVNSKDERIKASAIDSVLDRTGYNRKTTQNIAVTHEDNRSTAELLKAIRSLAGPRLALPVIEGEVVGES